MKRLTNKDINKNLVEKPMIWERYGKCKQCGECCKFITIYGRHEYFYNFGKVFYSLWPLEGKYVKIDKKCKQCKNKKCKIFNKKSLPRACQCFPMGPDDYTYMAVKDFCGFKFKLIDYKEKNKKK